MAFSSLVKDIHKPFMENYDFIPFYSEEITWADTLARAYIMQKELIKLYLYGINFNISENNNNYF